MEGVQGGLLQSWMFYWVTMNCQQINLFIGLVCSRTLHMVTHYEGELSTSLKKQIFQVSSSWIYTIPQGNLTLSEAVDRKKPFPPSLSDNGKLQKSLTLYTTHYHSVFDVKCYWWHCFSLLYQLQIYCNLVFVPLNGIHSIKGFLCDIVCIHNVFWWLLCTVKVYD